MGIRGTGGDALSAQGDTYINVDHPRFGGNIQAAINAHTAGTVVVPARTTPRELSTALSLPPKVSLLGMGPDASILRWPTTLGAGEWGLDAYPDQDGTYHNNTISGISLRGPAYGRSLVYGTAGTDMHGLRVGRRTLVDRVGIYGFHYGFGFGSDHAWLKNSTVNSNHHNVVWLTSESRWGDHSIMSCDLNTATLSTLSVEDGTFIDSSVFIDVHLGGAPYGIYAIGSRETHNFLSNSVFLDVAIEWFGNSAIKTGSADLISSTYFLGGSAWSQDSGRMLPDTTYDHEFDVGVIQSMVIDNPGALTTSPVPGSSWIHSSGNSITGVHLRNPKLSLLGSAASGKPILSFANGTGAAVLCSWKSSEASGRFRRSTSALAKGQHTKTTGRETCDLYGTSDAGPSAGIAKHACAANENVALITAGYSADLIAGASVGAGKFLKPDTGTAGRLIEASGPADGNVVGASYTAQGTVGSAFQGEVRAFGMGA